MPRWYGKGRRSIRLSGYDYSSTGYYFVTLCVQDRRPLLGKVVEGVMWLNEYGRIVEDAWRWVGEHYDHVDLDEFVIMPDHKHAIIQIIEHGGKPLGRLIGAFKTVSTKRINRLCGSSGQRFWQRNYYERVVRDEEALNEFRRYMQNNPRNFR
jgi:REP element-mobilizing transposase RayT